VAWNGGSRCVQGVGGVSDNEADEKTFDDPHKLLDINLDEFVFCFLLTDLLFTCFVTSARWLEITGNSFQMVGRLSRLGLIMQHFESWGQIFETFLRHFPKTFLCRMI